MKYDFFFYFVKLSTTMSDFTNWREPSQIFDSSESESESESGSESESPQGYSFGSTDVPFKFTDETFNKKINELKKHYYRYLNGEELYYLPEDFEFTYEFKKYLLKTLGKDKITQGISSTEKQENSKKNVMYMLLLLFKTVYPKENNINSSFTEFLDQYSSGINFNSVLDLKPTYTYLKESGTEYTVLRALYLNDIFNNNVYRKLFEAYYDYYVWCDKEKNKVTREEKINKAKIERLIRDYRQ